MADLNDLIGALNAVADEHGTEREDSDLDSESGRDDEEQNADNFRRRMPRQSEKLLAKVQFQAEVALQRKSTVEQLQVRRSQPGKVASLIDDIKRKQLRSLEVKTAALRNQLAI